jgi:hypothetical protein
MKKRSANREKGFAFIVEVKTTSFQIAFESQPSFVFEKPSSIHELTKKTPMFNLNRDLATELYKKNT